jgi:hypothetical protein
MKIQLTLKDPQAIEVVKSIPKEKRNEVIEKYIILGNTVVTQAEINTSTETVENFFAPLREDIETIRKQLNQIVPTMTTPARKGEVTVKSIYDSFTDHFRDDSFEDVSPFGKYADIKSTTADTKTQILIELKDYSDKVPTTEVEKFWRDLEIRNARYGIFISMRTEITKISTALKMETNMGRTAIFVVNSELNWTGHLFAYYVLKKIIELEAAKKTQLTGEDLSKVVTRLNSSLNEIRKDTEIIEKIQTIADSLKTNNTNKLGELIGLANSYKRRLDEKLREAFQDIEKMETK